MVLTEYPRISKKQNTQKIHQSQLFISQGKDYSKSYKKVFEIRAILEFIGIPCLDVMVLLSALLHTLRTLEN